MPSPQALSLLSLYVFFPSRAKEAEKKQNKITPDLKLEKAGTVAGTETFAASFPVVLSDFGFDVIAMYSSRNDPDRSRPRNDPQP